MFVQVGAKAFNLAQVTQILFFDEKMHLTDGPPSTARLYLADSDEMDIKGGDLAFFMSWWENEAGVYRV